MPGASGVRRGVIAVVIGWLAVSVQAQNAAAPAQQVPAGVPSEVRLGARVEALRRRWPVAPIVVIADSAEAYLQAVGQWDLSRRFPVLIDDGTDAAREDIARFVRAFAPGRVVLYSAQPGPATAPAAAVARAWGVEDEPARRALWAEHGFEPPGVVLASKEDPAWTAAVALAAGRGEVLVWVERPAGTPGRAIDPADLRRVEEELAAGLRTTLWSWRSTGDTIDAVTVCMNGPTKVPSGTPKSPMALTDHLGRHPDGSRWAWCGVIVGSESAAAYRAMSALFLEPDTAWLFSGYTKGGAFTAYDLSPAADRLRDAGLGLLPTGRPVGSRADWLREAIGGVRAGLVMVNSSGTRRRFGLAGSRAWGVDVPLLLVPSAVHFIHSFSAQNIDDHDSIARAWLDQGAFVYVGSVDEPFLRAFVTPAVLAGRLLAGAPFGAACRSTGKPWKLNYFGDPLYTVGPAAPRFAGAVDFPGLRSADRAAALLLKERRFGDAARLMVMLGRDTDVVDLARAVAKDNPDATDRALGGAALLAAVRRADLDAAAAVAAGLDRRVLSHPLYANPVWQLAEPVLPEQRSAKVAALLERIVRGARYAADADLAARAAAQAGGSGAAVLDRLIPGAPTDKARRELAAERARY